MSNKNDVNSCILCGKLYFKDKYDEGCCEECFKNVIVPYRKVINEYIIKNPNTNVLDIINSKIITVPEGYKISLTNFIKILLQSYTVKTDNKTSYKIDDNESALVRDLENLKNKKIKH